MRTRSETNRRLLACGVAAAALGLAGQALADDAKGAVTVQEVVVTANKRAEKLHDVAMGVTALGGDKLDRDQNVSFLDYAALVPSLSIETGGPGQTRLTLRGENAGGVGSTVAVYLDDSPFGSSNALANGSITTGDYDTWDLQRVEVLRGPQGTLYGASTEGGLVKFVPNAPNTSRFSAAAEAGGQSVDHGQSAGDVKAMVNLPLFDGKAALRISGYEEQLPGYISDHQLNLKNVNSGNKYGVRAAFLYKPVDSLTIKLTAESQLLRVGDPPQIDVVGAPLSPSSPPANQFAPVDGLNQNQAIHGYTKDRIENYSAAVTWNPGPISITSVTSFGILKLSTLSDLTSQEAAVGLTYGDYLGLLYGGTPAADESQLTGLHKFTQEIRIASRPAQKFEWQVGGFFTREDTVINQTINEIPSTASGPLVPGGDQLKASYTEWAGFADATYHFIPQFDIEAGARWSTNTQAAITYDLPGLLTTGGGPTTASTYGSTGSDFTYSVAPRWHVTKDTLIYGRVSTGYRPGGPNDIPTGAPAAVPRSYASDSTFNYEVGLRSSLLNHRLSIDVAAFHIDWSNIQLFELLIVSGTPYGINGNGGNARSQGVEWTVGLFPVKGLSLNWTGAYTDAVMTSIAAPGGIAGIEANAGDKLPFVPTWQTALDAQYEWNLPADFKAFVGGTWAYSGSRYSSFASYGSPDVTHAKLPAYDTIALRAGVERNNWRVELYGKNLGDSRGFTEYTSQGGVSGGNLTGLASIIQPRTVGLLLSAKFN